MIFIRHHTSIGTRLIECHDRDLSDAKLVITGTSNISGRENFSVESTLNRREARAFASSIYSHQLSETRILSGVLRVSQAPFGSKEQIIAGIRFENKF